MRDNFSRAQAKGCEVLVQLMHELCELERSGHTELGLKVDHIDGNNRNNCASYLQFIERREHMRKTGAQQKKRKRETLSPCELEVPFPVTQYV